MKWIEKLKFNKDGLIPAIIQDYKTKDVLMVAYMDKDALKKTIKSRKTHFYSRARKKIWKKGETSGHTQSVKALYYDCDRDTLLIKVSQKVGACHLGYRSCFYVKSFPGKLKITQKRIFDPDKVY